MLNDGAALKLPHFFRPIILYVCPIYLLVLLVSWMATNGLDVLLLTSVKPDEMVTFLGFECSKIAFTWSLRIFLVLVTILLNVAIAFAWKNGKANKGRKTTIKQVELGNS